MALSLQDLLVGFDAGAPQAPRANAPAPRGKPNQSDPFAALFAAKTNSTPAPRAAQPSATADASRPRPQRPTNADTAPSDRSAPTKTDKTSRTTDREPVRADDKASASPKTSTSTDSRTDKSADTSADKTNDKTDDTSTDNAATASTAPAGIAPAVDVFQIALLASAQGADAANGQGTAAPAAAIAPTSGAANANAAAPVATPVPTADATAKPSNSDLPNAIAELLAKGNNAKAGDDAQALAALASNASGAVVDTTAAAPKTTAPTVTPTTTPATDTPATATNTQAPQPGNTGPNAQASAVAQVAVQASRAPGATADAVHQVVQTNGTVQAAQQVATAQVAAQTARPAEITGKTAAPRVDGTNKSSNTTTKSASDDTTTPTAPVKDAATANAVAPITSTVDDTPLATAVAVPPPAVDGDSDAPAPAQSASAATPIGAPVAGNQQAHQVYAQAAARAPALPQVTVDQVVAHVAKAADDGIDRLTIQLKPGHLGAIEVKLEMHDDGGLAKATISADRADTLDLLQRDSHRLERALENAGIKADAGSLSFNLRGDGGRQQPMFTQDNSAAPSRPSYTTDDSGVDTAVVAYLNARVARGGVDIRV